MKTYETASREVETSKKEKDGGKYYRVPIKDKIKEWPRKVFGKGIDTSSNVWRDFEKLKDLRDRLMHFKGRWHKVAVDDITIEGLQDNSLLGKF